MWIQQKVRDRTIKLRKVLGMESPADLLNKTHFTSPSKVGELLGKLGCTCSFGFPAPRGTIREESRDPEIAPKKRRSQA